MGYGVVIHDENLATVHAVENHDLLDAINSTYNRTNLVVLDTILIQYLLLPYFPRVNLAGCKLPGYKLTSRYVEIRQKSVSLRSPGRSLTCAVLTLSPGVSGPLSWSQQGRH